MSKLGPISRHTKRKLVAMDFHYKYVAIVVTNKRDKETFFFEETYPI